MDSMTALLLGVIGVVLAIASSMVSSGASADARKYIPYKFHERTLFRTTLGVFAFSPPVPRVLQRRFLISSVLGVLAAGTLAAAFFLGGHDDGAMLFGGGFLFALVSSLKSFRSYLTQ
jgi:hypothetical protein